jgi:GR25 family glycosyltransferase involved in LPS biosynthesis
MQHLTHPTPENLTDHIVISLKRQAHKLDVFKSRYVQAGFSLNSLTVLEGYDASAMTQPPPMTLRQMDDINKERYDHRFFNKPGGFGCYLSHVQAWKWILEKNKPCIIFEDDAYFHMGKKTPSLIQKMFRKVDAHFSQKEARVVFLGYIEVPGFKRTFERTITEEKMGKPFLFHGIMHGLQGYYVTPAAARILIENAFPIEMQVDSYIGMLATYRKDLALIACKKSLVNQQNVTDSNIQSKCTFCNGYVNSDRFRGKTLAEKKEICKRMGGCPPDLISSSPSSTAAAKSLLGIVVLAASFLLFKKK